MSHDRLVQLARDRGVPWDALAEDLSDIYEWQVSVMEVNTRFRLAGRAVHDEPGDAFAEALELRDAALACGFVLHSRCEIGIAAVTESVAAVDDTVTGWRARVDLGLRQAQPS